MFADRFVQELEPRVLLAVTASVLANTAEFVGVGPNTLELKVSPTGELGYSTDGGLTFSYEFINVAEPEVPLVPFPVVPGSLIDVTLGAGTQTLILDQSLMDALDLGAHLFDTGVPLSSNTLQANSSSGATWTIDAPNSGTLGLGVTFVDVGNLVGGTGPDTFDFLGAGVLTGSIDGGGGGDTINWSATSPQSVGLTGVGAGGFDGTDSSIGGGFTTIENLYGSTGSTLTGLNASANWALNASGIDTYTSTDTLTFSGFANLVGGSDADTFTFGNGAFLSGSIDGGGGGANALDWSAYSTPRNVILTGVSGGGFAGKEASIGGGFSNTQTLTGSAGSSLTGINAAATWSLGTTDTYTSTNALTFSNFTQLTGGSVSDTFNIAGAQPVSLKGGGGAANFIFADGSSVTGSIDGGTGQNSQSTLDWSAYSTPLNVALTSPGTSQGFDGSEATIGKGFADIDTLKGGTGVNTLTGINATATWDLPASGPDTYTSTSALTFTGFANLVGGTVSDTFHIAGTQPVNLSGGGGAADFILADKAGVTGSIDGGAGTNGPSTLDRTNDSAALNVALTSLGISQGFDGTEASIGKGFANIDTLKGGTGVNALTGLQNAAATWDLGDPLLPPGNDTYTSTNTLTFTGFANLVGGTVSDTFHIAGPKAVSLSGGGGAADFIFADGAGVTGRIDGGSGASTLDWSAVQTARNVALTSLGGSHGFDGGEGSIGGGFANIDTLNGPAAAGGYHTGLDAAATWDLPASGPDTYKSTNTLTFTGFTNLVGGSVSDTFNIAGAQPVSLAGGGGAADFIFADGASVTGRIDGGTGKNGPSTLDWSADSAALNVALTSPGNSQGFAGLEATIGGGFTDIDVLKGGTGVNALAGINAAATWSLGTTDTYTSTNTLTFSNFTQLAGGTVSDSFNIAGAQPVSLAGGGGVASFAFADGSSVTGTIDGGTGPSSIIGPNADTAWTINAPDAGQVSFITGGFTNIGSLTGGSGANTYTFTDTGSLSGNLDGGSGTASNNEIVSAGDLDDTWNVTGIDSGNVPLIAGGFRNVGGLDVGGGTDSVILTQPGHLTGFVRGEGDDTLQGDDSTWFLTGENKGTSDDVNIFDGFKNLIGQPLGNLKGGKGNDTFIFMPGGSLTGSIDGGGGTATLDWSNYDVPLLVTLEGLGKKHGFAGTEPATIRGGFTNIDSLIGSNKYNFTLQGLQQAPATWDLPAQGRDTYTSANTLTFSGFDILVGGGSRNNFNIAGAQPVSLFGGGGFAYFAFADGARVTGTIDGGTGQSAVDWSAYSTPRNVALTSPGSSHGFNGNAASIDRDFTNIDFLFGPDTAGGALTGLQNAAANWTLAANATGLATYKSTNTLFFNSFTRLAGGTVSDNFNIAGTQNVSLAGGGGFAYFAFADGARVTGTIDGGTGPSILDWIDYSTARKVVLNGLGASHGFSGREATIVGGFINIDNLFGPATAGGSLTGRNFRATWRLGLFDTYTSTNTLKFGGFTQLTGGSDDDMFDIAGTQKVSLTGGGGIADFVFDNGARVTGTIDGGTGPSFLAWTDYSTARNVVLEGLGASHGFSGREATIDGGFTNIDNLFGPAVAGGTLTGRNAVATWSLGTTDTYTYTSTNKLAFRGFTQLVGGTISDTFNVAGTQPVSLSGGGGFAYFVFAGGASVTGTIDGGTGPSKKIIGPDSDPTWTISSPDAGTTSFITEGFSNIDSLTGGSDADTFTFTGTGSLSGSLDGGSGTASLNEIISAGDLNTTWNVTGLDSGQVPLIAGGFRDIGSLDVGGGTDSVILTQPGLLTGFVQGEGDDTLQGDDSTWTITGKNQGTSSDVKGGFLGFGSLKGHFQKSSLTGGTDSDTFIFMPGGFLTGTIDGGVGTATLDFSALQSAPNVSLTGLGQKHGFAGSVLTSFQILPGFTNIDTLIGSNSAGGRLGSVAGSNAFWNLNAGDNNTYITTGAKLSFSGFSALVGGGFGGTDTFIFGKGAVFSGTINGAGSSALILGPGSGTGTTWTINGFNAGTSSIITGDFSNIGTLFGGGGTNTFQFAGKGAQWSGTIDGGGGTATLNFSAYENVVSVALQASGGLHGFNGTVPNVVTAFLNVDNLVGPAGQSTLTGMPNATATWSLPDAKGLDAYAISTSGNTVEFQGFTQLVGGTASDTFNINGPNQPVSLTGGGGVTNFVFADGARVAGTIDGGAGPNASSSLDWRAYATARQVALTSPGNSHGFNGQDATPTTSIGGGFTNIDNLYVPSVAGGTLTGVPNATATWRLPDVTGRDAYAISTSANGVEFQGFTQLNGGTVSDTFDINGPNQPVSLAGGGGIADFVFADGSGVTGSIDGGTGPSFLYWTAYKTARNVVLTGLGASHGFAGTEPASIGGGFTNIDNLFGPATAGGSLAGLNAPATWSLGTTNTYTSTNPLAFRGFTQLTGGTVSDTFNIAGTQPVSLAGGGGVTDFIFADGSSVTGTIDGGTGISSLHWSAYATARDVALTSPGNLHGFDGQDVTQTTSIGGGFTNIDNLYVPSVAGGTLTGMADATATWSLAEAPFPSAYAISTGANTVEFQGFTQLVGGLVWDTFDIGGKVSASLTGGGGIADFVFDDGSSVTGTIDGGAGPSVLDWTAYKTARNLVLTGLGDSQGFAGTEASIGVRFTDIDTLNGPATAGGSLTGLSSAVATWRLLGANGGDTYADTLSDAALNFSGFTQLNGGTVSDTFDINGPNQPVSLGGGAGISDFVFADGASVTGTIDGGTGPSTLDWSAYSRPLNVALTSAGNSQGFNGTEASITGDFLNISNLIVPAAPGSMLTGMPNAKATWSLPGANGFNTYAIAGSRNNVQFQGFTQLVGGMQLAGGVESDTFNIKGDVSASLTGGGGTTNFLFAGKASITGTINGGTGTSFLNWSSYATPRDVALTSAGDSHGFNGQDVTQPTSITRGFTNIDVLIGPAQAGGTLTGMPNVTAAWSLFDSRLLSVYTIVGNQNTVKFLGFTQLVGGMQLANGQETDTFDIDGEVSANLTGGGGFARFLFANGASVTGAIDGGTGSGLLDWSAYATQRNVELTSPGNLHGFAGTEASIGVRFTNIDVLIGPAQAGGTLTGMNALATWDLPGTTGSDSYIISTSRNVVLFSNFRRLVGGIVSDTFDVNGNTSASLVGGGGTTTFEFADEAVLDGSIDGGTGSGSIFGPDVDPTWTINGPNAGQASFITGTFSNIGSLTGGSGPDTFTFTGTGSLSGSLDGGGTASLNEIVSAGDLDDTWNVTGLDSGNVPLIAGGFQHVGSLDVGGGTDSVILTQPGHLTGFVHGEGDDTLQGDDSTWTITGLNEGLSTDVDGGFVGMENLVGDAVAGEGNDTFIFKPGGELTGSITGGAGTSTLDWSAVQTAPNVTLTGLGASHGFAGTEPATIVGGFTEIDVLIGPGSAGSTLTGLPNATATWSLPATGAETYTISTSTNTLDFSGFTQLVGGKASDTFDIAGTQPVNLAGGGGFANFVFADGASLTGSIDGGAGSSTLDWSAVQTGRDVVLTGLGTSHGLAGTEATIGKGFTEIDTLVGPTSAGGSLTGMNAVATWSLGTTDTYTSTNTLAFVGFTRLAGGTISDTFDIAGTQPVSLAGGGGATDFVFADKASVTGTIDGGTGKSTVDWSAYSTPRDVTLTSLGASQGFAGTEATIGGGFADIDTLAGPATAGGTLTGMNAAATWNLPASGPDTYTSTNTLTFAGFTQLAGGSVSDTFNIAGAQPVSLAGGGGAATFNFADGARVTGTIDGGTGPSTLNWSVVQTARNVVLTGEGASHDFAGTEASVGGGFNDIDTLYAPATAGGSLTGLNHSSVWNLNANGTDTYFSIFFNKTLTFTGFTHLVGGSIFDVFQIAGTQPVSLTGGGGITVFFLADGASVTGTIDGGTGLSQLDWSASLTARNVALTGLGTSQGFAGTEATIGGGFTNIDLLVASGSAGGTVTGINAAATWTLGPGTNSVATYAISTSNASVSLFGFTQLVGGTISDTFNIAGTQPVSLKGGGGITDFVFADEASITGPIDGGTGASTLDWSADSTAPNVSLLSPGSSHGFNGTDASIGGGFSNVDNLYAPANAGGVLTGLQNATATWTLPATGLDHYAITTSNQTINFSGFTRLAGGTISDTFQIAGTQPVRLAGGGGAADFVFADGAGVTGTIDGGTGPSTLDWSAVQTARDVVLTGPGTSHGFAGTEATIGGGFTDIDTLVGPTSAGSSLTGTNATATWSLPASGPDIYTSTNTLTFTGFTQLAGGTVSDTFNIAGAQPVSLKGGGGAATFNFADGSSVTGTIDGGTGPSTLNWSVVQTARNVTLTSPASSHGYAGTEASIGGGFNDIDTVYAPATAGGALTGIDAPAIWTLPATGLDTYLSANGATLAFAGFTQLVGGGGMIPDRFMIAGTQPVSLAGGVGSAIFVFADGARVTGTIDGGTDPNGTSTLDWSAYSTARQVTLTSVGGSVGFGGTEASIGKGFTHINNLLGGTGVNTLRGLNAAATWNVGTSGLIPDYYTSTNSLTFTGFAQLVGGTVADTFDIVGTQAVSLTGGGGATDFFFVDGARVTGTIDGGTGASTLDWSPYSTPRNVTLSAPGVSHGFAGTEATIGGGFTNIDTLVAPANAGGTLTCMYAVATWTLPATGLDTYAISTSKNTLNFGGFTQLVGGGGQDTFDIAGTQPVSLAGGGGVADFVFADKAQVTGSIEGGAGQSTLDWSAYSTLLQVALNSPGTAHGFAGTEASVGGGFDNIDTLYAPAAAGGTLTGMSSADATWSLPASGLDTYAISTSNESLTFTGFAQLVGGTVSDVFDIAGTQNVSLAGGGGYARFNFADGSSVAGSIDGGTGVSLLDFSAVLTARKVNLTSGGAAHGFAGTEASIGKGFTNIGNLLGGASLDDALTGLQNAAATWVLGPNGIDFYGAGSRDMTFAGFERLTAGQAADQFYINGYQPVSLYGNNSRVDFIFADGARVKGTIDGGTRAGANSVQWTAYSTPRNVTLTGLGASQGFSGTEASIGGGFTNISFLYASGSAGGSLTGINAAATWDLGDPLLPQGYDTYTSTNTLGFSNFTQLTGGTVADTFKIAGFQPVSLAGGGGVTNFVFADGANVTGTIDGGTGKSTVDWSAYSTARNVVLTGPGTSHGFAGTEATIGGGFDNIDNLVAPATADGSLAGIDAVATWSLGTTDTYKSTNSLTFAGFTQLVGGTASDAFKIAGVQTVSLAGGGGANDFVFADGARVTGTIDGGTGPSTLDWSAVQTARNVALTGLGHAPKFDGTEATIGGGFTNINNLVASGSAGGTLTGINAYSLWRLSPTGKDDYLVGFSDLTFSRFTHLVGGTLNDTFAIGGTQPVSLAGGGGANDFVFADGARVTGTIDGGTSSSTLSWSDYSTARNVVLTRLGTSHGFAGTEATIGGGFDDIDTLNGPATAGGKLTGTNGPATWGLTANDLDTYTIYTSKNTYTLDFGGFAQLVGGTDSDEFEIAGTQDVSLAGGGGFTSFNFADGSSVTGTIDGGTGQGVLNWSDYSTPRKVALSAPGFSHGFTGTEATIGGGFTDISTLVAPANAGGTLTGMNAVATWNLPASGFDTYAVALRGDALIFSGFTQLVGGGYSDTFHIAGAQPVSLAGGGGLADFVFADGASVTGPIDGGAGPSTLDWSAYSTPRNVKLTSIGPSHGFNGTEPSIVGGFANIDDLIGGSSFTDSLTGLATGGKWSLSGTDTYQSGSNILTFSNFEQLSGPGVPDPSQTKLTGSSDNQGRVTLTAQVTATDGIAPQGTMAFYDGSALVGVATLKNRSAVFLTGALSHGNHTFTAVYSSDSKHNISVGSISLNI
jgi:hypothetical protein